MLCDRLKKITRALRLHSVGAHESGKRADNRPSLYGCQKSAQIRVIRNKYVQIQVIRGDYRTTGTFFAAPLSTWMR